MSCARFDIFVSGNTFSDLKSLVINNRKISAMKMLKKEDMISWGILGAIILIVYFVFSDGQFSLIFTLAGTVQTFGFVLIVLKIRKSRSVGGLSRETFICYTVIFGARFFLFIFFRVHFKIFRATSPTIPLVISSSRSRKQQLSPALAIFCTA